MQLKYRFSWSLYVKAASILGAVALGFYLTFFTTNILVGLVESSVTKHSMLPCYPDGSCELAAILRFGSMGSNY